MSKMTAEELANLLISIHEEAVEKTGGDSIATIMAFHKIIKTCKKFSTKQTKGTKHETKINRRGCETCKETMEVLGN